MSCKIVCKSLLTAVLKQHPRDNIKSSTTTHPSYLTTFLLARYVEIIICMHYFAYTYFSGPLYVVQLAVQNLLRVVRTLFS